MNYTEIAAKALNMPEEEIKKCTKFFPEQKLHYFWQPLRGGRAVLIGEDGSRLIAGSAVRFEEHLNQYLAGRRN